MSLSPKHQLFIDKYFENNFNATKAYQSAYPDCDDKSAKDSASRLLANVSLKQAIDKRKELQHNQSLVTVKEVVDDIKEVLARCMTKEPVMEWDKGAQCLVETGEWQFKENGALKALELLGRHIGAFKDIREYSITTKSDEMINQLNDIIGKPAKKEE